MRTVWYILFACALGAAFANRTYLMSLDYGHPMAPVKANLPEVSPDCKLANPRGCLGKAK